MSSSSEEECKTSKKTHQTTNSPRFQRKPRRASTVNVDELRYPALNITVTQSPKSLRRRASFSQVSNSSPKRLNTPQKEWAMSKMGSPSILDRKQSKMDCATRKLNFDRNSTILEEKIECQYRLNPELNQPESQALATIKEHILFKTSKSDLPIDNKTNVSEITNVTRLQETKDCDIVAKQQEININNETNVMIAMVTKQQEANEVNSQTNDVSDDSDELFSPQSDLHELNTEKPSKLDENFLLTSSLETLITPYQENQCPDQVWLSYDSQTNIFDDSTKTETNKTTILSKADEYDISKKMLPIAGPSKCPSSFESIIQFQTSISQPSASENKIIECTADEKVHTETISVLDLTSNLEINEYIHQINEINHIKPKFKPPPRGLIQETMSLYKIPHQRNTDPFYSDSKHVTGPIEVGFNTLCIKALNDFKEFHSSFPTLAEYQKQKAGVSQKELRQIKLSYFDSKSVFVKPVKKAPSVKEVKLWLVKQRRIKQKNQLKHVETDEHECKEVKDHDTTELLGLTSIESTQTDITSPKLNKSGWDNSHAISGVSLNNTHGFKMTLENLQDARSLDIYQYITSLVVEIHTDSRGDKMSDPQVDPVNCLFFALANDVPDKISLGVLEEESHENFIKGFISIGPNKVNILNGTGIIQTKYTYLVDDELGLFHKFLELFSEWNPDILIGYEIEQASLGYLVERGYVLGLNLPSLLSRIKDEKVKDENDPQEELHSHLKITGRIVLDLWRILKHEIALQSYTFENLAYHVLHERVPHYSPRELTLWWNHKHPKFRLIDHYDLIGRTSELARLFGILFYEVLSRGSQFRVESMMLRLAKPCKYVPVSPSVQQRAHMKAPEFLPLILEPESKFYKDPVIVLDFQSLYPSIIIAYNYCFSTCLGRIENLINDGPFEFGAYELEVSRKLIGRLLKQDLLTISPCGVAFVKNSVRPGIMPRMLREILDTRLMVKKSMKRHKANKTLQKVLHSRQLGLKLIANVTYGYTAANFSGRMPACELADSVVSKGRETLQRAINLVEQHRTWGARVVYGDTDSLFVLCEGKTREQAFNIGEEIVDAVTSANPSPVKLKLEKVYQPCILQTKKRYVGYMYESKDQKTPEFEAKGIETVRRDGCPAASKMLEKCLRLLFDSRDVSQIRNYVLKQFNKILTGRVSIQDLTFAKEYRGRDGYRPGACVPALELTRKWMSTDKRKEPRSGERVPYVIINGPPGLPLIKLVKSPHALLEDSSLRPNGLYYITKAIIPPINRCFKLIGADLFNWFNEMPRKQVQYLHVGSPSKGPKSTISQYFATAACASCGMQTKDGLCAPCRSKPQSTLVCLHGKVRQWERNFYTCKKICESCCCRSTDLLCNSLDCPVLYRSKQTLHDLQQADFVRGLFGLFPDCL